MHILINKKTGLFPLKCKRDKSHLNLTGNDPFIHFLYKVTRSISALRWPVQGNILQGTKSIMTEQKLGVHILLYDTMLQMWELSIKYKKVKYLIKML